MYEKVRNIAKDLVKIADSMSELMWFATEHMGELSEHELQAIGKMGALTSEYSKKMTIEIKTTFLELEEE